MTTVTRAFLYPDLSDVDEVVDAQVVADAMRAGGLFGAVSPHSITAETTLLVDTATGGMLRRDGGGVTAVGTPREAAAWLSGATGYPVWDDYPGLDRGQVRADPPHRRPGLPLPPLTRADPRRLTVTTVPLEQVARIVAKDKSVLGWGRAGTWSLIASSEAVRGIVGGPGVHVTFGSQLLDNLPVPSVDIEGDVDAALFATVPHVASFDEADILASPWAQDLHAELGYARLPMTAPIYELAPALAHPAFSGADPAAVGAALHAPQDSWWLANLVVALYLPDRVANVANGRDALEFVPTPPKSLLGRLFGR